MGSEVTRGRLVEVELLVARGKEDPASAGGRAVDAAGQERGLERPEAEAREDIHVGALYRYRAGRQDASLDVSGRGEGLVEY